MTNNSETDKPGQDTIVQMRRFRSGKSLSPIHQAEAYWTALRQGSGIPERGQVDPRGLENLLPHTFVLERIAPSIARFRLAGQTLQRLAGTDLRGMPLSVLVTPDTRHRIGKDLQSLFDTPAVAEFSLISEARPAHTTFEARMLLLPLKTELGEISRALGVLVADTPVRGHGAVRFEITGSRLRPVSGRRQSDQAAPAATAKTTPGFAAPPAPPYRGAPHLRLVKTGD